MTKLVGRWAIAALVVALVTVLGAPPAMADLPSTSHRTSLTRLSPASVKILRSDSSTAARAPQAGGASESFFGSTKGKVAVGLMIAGAAFTVWSINHDRKPVKSPVR